MQLFILIVINIALGTVFYLVISLKLEKSASEYREKKFRREMDEVIREFNNTAERNISLLENKINVMKKLLRESGQLSSIDITLGDKKSDRIENPDFSAGNEGTFDEPDTKLHDHRQSAVDKTIMVKKEKSFNDVFYEKWSVVKNFLVDLKDKFPKNVESKKSLRQKANFGEIGALQKGNSFDITIEKDFTSLNLSTDVDAEVKEELETEKDDVAPVQGENLEEMFSGADDKYGLVADLYKQGYPLDVLARSSGIPIGELKLILNLSSSL